MNQRKFICETLKYIDQYYGNRLVLAELAKTSGYSIPHFSRLFYKYTGITPMRYVNIVRIQSAEKYLSETDKSITDIAFECGFESLEVFERSFKKFFGISASQYRAGYQLAPSPFYLSEQIYFERMRSDMKIDGGNVFDWGKTAESYAKSRNIYPQQFWDMLHNLGVGDTNQKVLDIGTGTGILPMNMKKFGGKYTGVDISSEMIEQAKFADTDSFYVCADAHDLPFGDESFDVITALQCWVYFDKSVLLPEFHRVLKTNGSLFILFMTWLPDEDEIIRKSFAIVKRYNPRWSGFMKRAELSDFHWLCKEFSVESFIKNDYRLLFSQESWCDRMIASRGIGATLNAEEIAAFKNDLMNMLQNEADDHFTVLHEAVIIKLKKEDTQ